MKTYAGSPLPIIIVLAVVFTITGMMASDRLIGRRNGIRDVNEYWPQNWPVFGSWITLLILLRWPHLTPQLRKKV